MLFFLFLMSAAASSVFLAIGIFTTVLSPGLQGTVLAVGIFLVLFSIYQAVDVAATQIVNALRGNAGK